MKERPFAWGTRPWLGMAISLMLLAGCATTPKINWPARVGVYTLDQAVLDYGPPDKQARLQDGTVVAEWITAHGFAYGYIEPGFYYGSHWGYSGPITYAQTRIPDYILRLTFRPDGKLSAWKDVIR